MEEFRFVGWLADSNFGSSYIDDDRYFPLLEKLEQHNGALYHHPPTH